MRNKEEKDYDIKDDPFIRGKINRLFCFHKYSKYKHISLWYGQGFWIYKCKKCGKERVD